MYRYDTTDRPSGQDENVKKARDILEIARDKRRASLIAADYMQPHISAAAHSRMLHCGDVLIMLEDELREHRKLKDAWFCGKRMCPGCEYRASLVNAVMLSAISGAMTAEGRISIMVTLTAPNCTGEQLSDEMRRYNSAWNDLVKHEPYRSAWRDHVRKMEVTYNRDVDTYHPHIHALVYVTPSYFNGRNYISHDRLLRDWRRVMHDNSITQVHLQRSYGEDWRNIAELSKYVAKSGDYLYNQGVFDTFYRALRGKRLRGYAGRCRELRAAYKRGELTQYVERDLTRYVWLVVYTDYQRTGQYAEETRKPYDSLIMGDDDIPISALLPQEWDELAD